MMRIERDRRDREFSKYIKERDFVCQTFDNPIYGFHGGIYGVAHIAKRGGFAVRWRRRNGIFLCGLCHSYYEHHEQEFHEFLIENHGYTKEEIDELLFLGRQTALIDWTIKSNPWEDETVEKEFDVPY